MGQTRLGTLSPMAASGATWHPCLLPVPNPMLWGLLFQHSTAIATAEPQPSRHRGRGAVGDPPGKVSAQRQVWVHPGLKGKWLSHGVPTRPWGCHPISPWRVQHQEGSAISGVRSLFLLARTCLQFPHRASGLSCQQPGPRPPWRQLGHSSCWPQPPPRHSWYKMPRTSVHLNLPE